MFTLSSSTSMGQESTRSALDAQVFVHRTMVPGGLVWRIPFFCSLIVLVAAFLVRRTLPEADLHLRRGRVGGSLVLAAAGVIRTREADKAPLKMLDLPVHHRSPDAERWRSASADSRPADHHLRAAS